MFNLALLEGGFQAQKKIIVTLGFKLSKLLIQNSIFTKTFKFNLQSYKDLKRFIN